MIKRYWCLGNNFIVFNINFLDIFPFLYIFNSEYVGLNYLLYYFVYNTNIHLTPLKCISIHFVKWFLIKRDQCHEVICDRHSFIYTVFFSIFIVILRLFSKSLVIGITYRMVFNVVTIYFKNRKWKITFSNHNITNQNFRAVVP